MLVYSLNIRFFQKGCDYIGIFITDDYWYDDKNDLDIIKLKIDTSFYLYAYKIIFYGGNMQLIKNFLEKKRKQKINKLLNKIHELMKTGYYGTSMYNEFKFQHKKTI